MSRHDFETDRERREWEAQERALRAERAGARNDARAADARGNTGIYRLVVRALANPRLDALPSDFAALTAARVEAGSGAADFVEIWLERGLVALLMLTGAAVVMSYSAQPMLALFASLPAPTDITPPPFGVWGLAIAACVGLTWVVDRLFKWERL